MQEQHIVAAAAAGSLWFVPSPHKAQPSRCSAASRPCARASRRHTTLARGAHLMSRAGGAVTQLSHLLQEDVVTIATAAVVVAEGVTGSAAMQSAAHTLCSHWQFL